MALPVWKLYVIARCQPLQSLLSRDEHADLAAALFQQHNDDDECGAAVASETAAQRDKEDATPSSHLERWKQWKLDADHIQRLTSAHVAPPDGANAAGSAATPADEEPPLSFLSDWIANIRFFARGKRGVLYTGELKSNGAGVVVKLGAASSAASETATTPSAASSSVNAEAKWLRVMNRMGIGAQLIASGGGAGWFICERLDGANVVEFLAQDRTTHANARWVLREMLCQWCVLYAKCFAMDLMGVNKEEMTHPHRHIIIHSTTTNSAAALSSEPTTATATATTMRQWKCSFIDFEKCALTRKPKNVTQLCQFLSSPRMLALFGAKGITFEIHKVRLATKHYKQKPSPNTFGELMRVFSL